MRRWAAVLYQDYMYIGIYIYIGLVRAGGRKVCGYSSTQTWVSSVISYPSLPIQPEDSSVCSLEVKMKCL